MPIRPPSTSHTAPLTYAPARLARKRIVPAMSCFILKNFPYNCYQKIDTNFLRSNSTQRNCSGQSVWVKPEIRCWRCRHVFRFINEQTWSSNDKMKEDSTSRPYTRRQNIAADSPWRKQVRKEFPEMRTRAFRKRIGQRQDLRIQPERAR